MTMHLAHPALSTTGRRKGRVKWTSAEQKRQHQELEAEWQRKMQELTRLSPAASRPTLKAKPMPKLQSPRIPPGRNTTRDIPSVSSVHKGAVSSPPSPQYTGDAVVGIAVMHKSCLQPIFSQEAAIDSARMRRG